HYIGKTPILNILEPEVIRNILVKDFHLFADRYHIRSASDTVVSKTLFHMNGDQWKRLRAIVSPTFSSGKMRKMFPRIRECLAELLEQLDGYAESGRPVDVKDMYENYTMDVIATCAFATKTNVYKGDISPFVINARKAFSSINIADFATLIPAFIKRWLGMAITKKIQFFIDSTKHILQIRRDSPNSKHNDFIQILMDAVIDKEGGSSREDQDANEAHYVNEGEEELAIERKTLKIKVTENKLTENEILAQAFMFFLAGYETSATTLSFLSYELAMAPDIQQRLYDEIMTNLDENTGEMDYDKLATLPYLDAVVSETLRMHSPAQRMPRVCSVEYALGDTGVVIPAGQNIDIPIYALHHCAEFYPQPFKFDPDRFLGENKRKVKPYTYLPFGAGPRNCIGMRFSLLEIKLGLAHIMKHYRFTTCPLTDRPIQYKRMLRIGAPQRMILGIEKRIN
ncbi:unnamed protein product, partial [Medioppia subpectinata]